MSSAYSPFSRPWPGLLERLRTNIEEALRSLGDSSGYRHICPAFRDGYAVVPEGITSRHERVVSYLSVSTLSLPRSFFMSFAMMPIASSIDVDGFWASLPVASPRARP